MYTSVSLITNKLSQCWYLPILWLYVIALNTCNFKYKDKKNSNFLAFFEKYLIRDFSYMNETGLNGLNWLYSVKWQFICHALLGKSGFQIITSVAVILSRYSWSVVVNEKNWLLLIIIIDSAKGGIKSCALLVRELW